MNLYPCSKIPPCPNNRRHHTPICPEASASTTKSISTVDLKTAALKAAAEQDENVVNTTVALFKKSTTFVDFIFISRCLSEYSRMHGLKDSTLKNRTRVEGSTRTLQVFPDDTAILSVSTHGRSRVDVLNDLVEGVGKRNDLSDVQIQDLKLAVIQEFLAVNQS